MLNKTLVSKTSSKLNCYESANAKGMRMTVSDQNQPKNEANLPILPNLVVKVSANSVD